MNDLTRPIPPFHDPDWQRVASVPINENHEPLRSLALASAFHVYLAYYHLGLSHAVQDLSVRESVLDRLLQAARQLPPGLKLVVLDAWRPKTVQSHLYHTLEDAMRRQRPHADANTLEHLTRQFVSPPSDDPAAPSPHLTGGAVDVTLCDVDGRWLDMGSAFDEVGPRSFSDHYESATAPAEQAIRDRRRILYNAMAAAGFSNLASEWWHYDFGDQLWAWHQQQPVALYGPTAAPRLETLWHQQLAERFAGNHD